MAQGYRGNSSVLVAPVARSFSGHIDKVYADTQLVFNPA